MKNLSKLFLAVLLSAVLFSCSDDDDYNKSDLKGFYASSKYESISVKTNNENVTNAILAEISEDEDEDYKSYIYFDGAGSGTSYYANAANSVIIADNEFTYDLKGSTLRLKDKGSVDYSDFKISSLSTDGFKVHINDTDSYQDAEDLESYEEKFDLTPGSLKITNVSYVASYVKMSESKPE